MLLPQRSVEMVTVWHCGIDVLSPAQGNPDVRHSLTGMEPTMVETIVGVAIGLPVLVVAVVFAAGLYRQEHLRNRVIRSISDRLYDFSRSRD
ncbi:hypothetical protein P3T23_002445 [Paraburkholderia sp. GAS448]|uniref:hypothetical protein n=1 Tax=Paraburkholderia sp. GAS448 TaxID=3035136 RepID=UPI003D1B677B